MSHQNSVIPTAADHRESDDLLEGGLGFAQFFWDRNRMCAQDRLAETIVVDVRKQSKQ